MAIYGRTLDTELAAARALPLARERIAATLAIDARGLPGAPALRDHQAALRARMARAQAGGWPLAVPRVSRAEWYRGQSSQRRRARDARAAAEAAAAERVARSALLDAYLPEVEARGGETTIVGQYGTEELDVADRDGEMVILHCEGWRQYSRRFGARRASLSYLCGTDDSGTWAVRVPGTLTTVSDALAYLEPADVARARNGGRRVLRQGDIYAIETPRHCDGRGLTDGAIGDHEWHERIRELRHPEHTAMRVPYPARYVQQRSLQMRRGAGHGAAD